MQKKSQPSGDLNPKQRAVQACARELHTNWDANARGLGPCPPEEL